jgi:hypothetical protein
MALYMTQKMSDQAQPAVTYYRKQANDHPSHAESGAFTTAAATAYATANRILFRQVELGTYKSNQGVPTGGTVEPI